MMVSGLIASLLPSMWGLMAVTAAVMVMVITAVYAAGKIINNPKVYVWAHDELFQLMVSLIVVSLMLALMNMATEVHFSSLTGPYVSSVDVKLPTSSSPGSTSFYGAAMLYLLNTACMAHNIMLNVRYYLSEIYLDQSLSHWKCAVPWCFMSQGGTGAAVMPYAGASYFLGVFSLFFQSALLENMMSLVHAQFLMSIYSGVLMFLLPLAVVLRSTPGLRPVGGVLMALLMAMYVVYPFILSMYAVVFLPKLPYYSPKNDDDLAIKTNVAQWLSGSMNIPTVSFGNVYSVVSELGNGLFYVMFLENAALLALVGAAFHISNLLGEQVNFSGLLQVI